MECVCNVLHRRAFCTCTKWNKTEKIINFESRERSECTCRANVCCQRFMPRRVIHLKACLACTERFFNSQHISCHHMAASTSSSLPFPCRTAHAECFVSITESFLSFFNFRIRRTPLQTWRLTTLWCDCCFAFYISCKHQLFNQNSQSRKVQRGLCCGWMIHSCRFGINRSFVLPLGCWQGLIGHQTGIKPN